ncbi:phage replisome organizer N-terminal domain-containing protein [Aerococcus sp. UMB1112A]|uniref:phage replisome organizer N-terminal domain-containing protein n=1 Tax=Aerococcus sp. UMB1112A TaxID=3050609 RepID=UPI00254EDFAD|nr:phage replisome organizer N-terminal domain-containing protein [Aerococcus sp. UMB1112A]MDK8502110.1 phage replisome organizer N-terminal domain-containing protein [Aerococcus sp. UMB1112A]
MADNRKYYYLKLKENFFEDPAIIILEDMQDGYKYCNILLKLYLRSLKGEGKLTFKSKIPYSPSLLAKITRHRQQDVERAIEIFEELELIEVLDNGAIFVSDIQNFIGKSSTEADRKREYRARIDSEKEALKSDRTTDQTDGQTNVPTDDQTNIRQNSTRDRDRDRVNLDIYHDHHQQQEVVTLVEESKKNNSDDDHDEMPKVVGQNAIDYYQRNYGIVTPNMVQEIQHWTNEMNEELVILAFKRSIGTKSPFQYAMKILTNWTTNNIRTVDQAEAEQVERERQRKKYQSNNQPEEKRYFENKEEFNAFMRGEI